MPAHAQDVDLSPHLSVNSSSHNSSSEMVLSTYTS
jgi:hypothetical protein